MKMDSWRNPPSPWRETEARTGSTRRFNRSHGWRPESHEVVPRYPSARRSTGQGVKPITEGFSPTLQRHRSQPRGDSVPPAHRVATRRSQCPNPSQKNPKNSPRRARCPSAAQSQEANKSPGRVANVGDGGRPWKTVQTGEIGLITRRSQVQILPPPPNGLHPGSPLGSPKSVTTSSIKASGCNSRARSPSAGSFACFDRLKAAMRNVSPAFS